MWSEPAASDDRIVVSDIGEQWSPNVPPPSTAPIVQNTNVVSSPPVIVNAKGITIGTMIANVPHEDPVKKEIRAHVMNVIVTSKAGVMKDSVKLMMKSAVPRPLVMELMQYAIARIKIALNTALIPSTAVAMSSLRVAILQMSILKN